MEQKLSLLQKLPIFGGIDPDIIQFILDLSKHVYIPKGEYYFKEGDNAKSMYVIETGSVAILKEWQGHQILLSQLSEGNCIGEMSLVDFCPRSASVVAEVDSTAIEITAATLHELYQKNLEQFTMIQMNIGREICRRLRETDKHQFDNKIEAKIGRGELNFNELPNE